MRRRISIVCALAISPLACTPTSPREQADVARAIKARVGFAPARPGAKGAALPPGVRLDDGLSEDDAAALALWHNPELQVSLTELGFAKADLFDAGAIPNPVLSLVFPLGPKQLEGNLGWDVSWIWKRPAAVAAAKLDVRRVAAALVQHGLNAARDARLLHANAVLVERRLSLWNQVAEIRAKMTHLAEVRLSAGVTSELELQSVRVEARLAGLDRDRERHEQTLALAALRQGLGLGPGWTGALRVVAAEAPKPPGELSRLIKRALAARPDLRAAEIAIQAAGERGGSENARIFELIAVLDMNAEGQEGLELGPGMTLPIPVFNQNQGGRERARGAAAREPRVRGVTPAHRARGDGGARPPAASSASSRSLAERCARAALARG